MNNLPAYRALYQPIGPPVPLRRTKRIRHPPPDIEHIPCLDELERELEGQNVSGADIGRIAAAALRISKGNVQQATAAAATVVHNLWGDNPAGLAADDLKNVLRGIITELRPQPRCCVVC